VRFSSDADARADAALGVALGFFTEGAQLRLIAESMKHARTLDESSIQLLLALAGERRAHDHALRVMGVRLGAQPTSLEQALRHLASE
jgi:hypothetical protein